MHFLHQPNRSSYGKSQAREVFRHHDYTMVENTVLVSHDGIITEKLPDISFSKYTDFNIQKISKTLTLSEKEIISHPLIRKRFGNTDLPREINLVNTKEFIIKYGNPHKPASSGTISRWIKDELGMAGMNSNV